MAGFVGTVWAPVQLAYSLIDADPQALSADAGMPAVSRSTHYGIFLSFEGIRFFVERAGGDLRVVFVNLHRNLERFRRGIAFNLAADQQHIVPTPEALMELFRSYFSQDDMRGFLEEMATQEAQGYLRPFTIDASQSIGVTFPSRPEIRVAAMRYDSYLGEPMHGVVVPQLVRAVGANGTGCLKLGGNYLMSVKAVQAARALRPDAAAALFLDDRLGAPLRERRITEWDTSCCIIALSDGSVVRIPDGPLILPSVTIRGLVALLAEDGIRVEERPMTYGELVDRGAAGEVVTVCSVGTAGILTRATTLLCTDGAGEALTTIEAAQDHPVYAALWRARTAYWGVYTGKHAAPEAMRRTTHMVGAQNWMPA